MTGPTPAHKPPRVTYRNMTHDDIPRLLELEAASFPSIPPDRHWQPAMLKAHLDKFPDGQLVAELEGKLVGSATSLRTTLTAALTPHTWRSIAGGGYLTTHDPNGDALYGTEIMVHPDARRRGIGRNLYKLRRDVARRLNCRVIAAGGRIPGYAKYADRMSAVEYVKSVLGGERTDRTLSAQLAAGFTVAGVMDEYMMDENSRNHATLLVWWNLDWTPRVR